MSLRGLLYRKEEKVEPISVSIDTQIASNIVDILYRYTNECLEEDTKLDYFTKSVTKNVLPGTADGTKKYIIGMNDSKIKNLLDDIQRELYKR